MVAVVVVVVVAATADVAPELVELLVKVDEVVELVEVRLLVVTLELEPSVILKVSLTATGLVSPS